MPPNKLLTLAFVQDENKVLLGMKKRGFGVGRWNGFGGKVQPGELVEDAAKRELEEESGLVATKMRKVGIMMNEFLGNMELLEIHVFVVEDYSGQLQESEEMQPKWFDCNKIPFDDMWPDDRYWFPLLLRGATFYVYVAFEGFDKVLDYIVEEHDTLNSITIPQEALYQIKGSLLP